PRRQEQPVGEDRVAVVELETPPGRAFGVDRLDGGPPSCDGGIGRQLFGGSAVEVGWLGAVVAEQPADAGGWGVGRPPRIYQGHVGAGAAEDQGGGRAGRTAAHYHDVGVSLFVHAVERRA